MHLFLSAVPTLSSSELALRLAAAAVFGGALGIERELRDHEADLVVLMPGFGVLVLEVKGGSVWYDDGWIQARGGEPHWIDPVAQARDAKYALRAYVEQRAVWGSRTRVRWSHGVVTPHSVFPQDFAVPELPRHALHDRDDLDHGAKLAAYRQLADEYFDTERYLDFCASRLAGFDEAAVDYFAGAEFDELLVATVRETFPAHEHDHFVEHYRGLIGTWVADQR